MYSPCFTLSSSWVRTVVSVCTLYTMLLVTACAPDPRTQTPSPDVEGPRGKVTWPGPYLVRVFLPQNIPAQLSYQLSYQLSSAPVDEPLSAQVPLSPSGQPEVWFAVLPPVPPQVEVRYTLESLDGDPLSLTFSYMLTLPPPDEARLDREETCALEMTAPPPPALLDPSEDESQTSGLQYTFTLNVSPLNEGWVTLKLGESSALAPISRGRVAFPKVTIPRGTQRVTFNAFSLQGTRCALTEIIRLDP